MFKAKLKKDGQIYQILDTFIDNTFSSTFFLIWYKDGWRWRSSNEFVPPNYEIKEK